MFRVVFMGEQRRSCLGSVEWVAGYNQPTENKKCQDLCQSVIFVFLQRLLRAKVK